MTGYLRSIRHVAGAAIALVLFIATCLPMDELWNKWWWQLLLAGLLLAACVSALLWKPMRGWLMLLGKYVQSIKRLPFNYFLAGSAIVFFIIAIGLSGSLFHHLPHNPDSIAQYIQANIFAHGALFERSSPVFNAFNALWIINDGKYYAMYPPGHALLLSLGMLVHLPWLVNPLLGAASLVAIAFITRELAGVAAARIAAILALASPFILFISSEFMNNASSLCMVAFFTLFYVRMIQRVSCKNAILAGIFLGLAFMTRPQMALAYGLPFAMHGMYQLIRSPRQYALLGCYVALGMAPSILFFLYFNWQTTGDAFFTGYEKYQGSKIIPGARLSWQSFPGDYKRMMLQANGMHQQLFGWPISSLWLVLALFLFRMQKAFCVVLIASSFLVLMGQLLTNFSWMDWGPRYLYEASVPLIILTAIAIARIPPWFRYITHKRIPLNAWRGLGVLVFLVLTIIAIQTTWSSRYQRYNKKPLWSFNPDIYLSLIKQVEKPALVLVVGQRSYRSVAFTNPPYHDSPIVFAMDNPAYRRKLLDLYPDRFVYVLSEQSVVQRIR